jgi:hypothetical protein
MFPTVLTSCDGEVGSDIEVRLRFNHWTRLRDCRLLQFCGASGMTRDKSEARTGIARVRVVVGLRLDQITKNHHIVRNRVVNIYCITYRTVVTRADQPIPLGRYTNDCVGSYIPVRLCACSIAPIWVNFAHLRTDGTMQWTRKQNL